MPSFSRSTGWNTKARLSQVESVPRRGGQSCSVACKTLHHDRVVHRRGLEVGSHAASINALLSSVLVHETRCSDVPLLQFRFVICYAFELSASTGGYCTSSSRLGIETLVDCEAVQAVPAEMSRTCIGILEDSLGKLSNIGTLQRAFSAT